VRPQREDAIAGRLPDVTVVRWTASIINLSAGSMSARASSGSSSPLARSSPWISANGAVHGLALAVERFRELPSGATHIGGQPLRDEVVPAAPGSFMIEHRTCRRSPMSAVPYTLAQCFARHCRTFAQ